jgi:3D (Asp-Asp-Asp) domain-containing protein
MVMTLRGAGVLAFDPTGRFRPDEPIRRAELFKMVLTARKVDTGAACRGQFLDVPCWAWYAPQAEMAYRMAIADLQGEDKLAPEGQVTRQELFAVIIRALGRRWEAANLGWEEINTRLKPFSDRDQVAYSAQPAMALALKSGIMSGYGDGTLRPQRVTTRAEAAAVISRILLAAEGLQTATVDGHKIVYKQAIDMTASEYTTGEPGVGWVTYTGLIVRMGTVAVDPSVVPLGRLLYVEGYGYAVAADIGGAIKGNRVDLFTFDYHSAALLFGMQPRKVYVLP